MNRKKSSYLDTEKFDSKILYFTISVIIFITYFVRMKIIKNFENFDGSIIPGIVNVFTYYKMVFLVVLVSILLLLLIYRTFKYKAKLRTDYVLWGTGLIIAVSTLATVFSEHSEMAIVGMYNRTNGFLTYISLFLFIYILSNINIRSKDITFIVHAINIASLGFTIIAIFQFFGLDLFNTLWFRKLYIPTEYLDSIANISFTQMKFKGTNYFWASSIFGQFNYYGAFCSTIYPVVTLFILKESHSIKKAALIFGSIMLFTGVILAQSMGSTVTLFIMVFLIFILFIDKSNYKDFVVMLLGYILSSVIINIMTKGAAFRELFKLINSKSIIIVILFAVIALIAFILARKSVLKYRYLLVATLIVLALVIAILGFMYILNNVVEANMGMLSDRGYVWYYSKDLIMNNYVLGYGPDNLYYNFPQNNPDKALHMPKALIDKPHNMYLQVVLDIGIFGLVGFVGLLIVLVLKLNKAIDTEDDLYKKTFYNALILLILSYMLQGIVNDNHLTIQPVIYMLLGIGFSLTRAKETLRTK